MNLPELTLCVVGYKRPWYCINTLYALINRINYAGAKRYVVSDGGSPTDQLAIYTKILGERQHRIVVTDNLSDMMNACAASAGEVWLTTLDDFYPIRAFDITPDVRLLLSDESVGAIRMGRLAFWGDPPGHNTVKAEMVECGGLHWWKVDKAQTTDPYICSINTTLYHRRFWDAYGDIPPCPPNIPGEAELLGAERFRNRSGPAIAIPMRFGEDCGDWQEPFWHMGMYRTDEYAAAGGGGRL